MKSRANRYLKRIARKAGVEDAARAIQILARDLGRGDGSLEALAHSLGVSEIVEEKLAIEGGLFKIPDKGLVVKLNADNPPSRKRFTLAHEIGHLLLGNVSGERSTSCEDPVLEAACDAIAAELLMPSEEAISFVRGLGKPSPENLTAVATQFGISLHGAAIRVHSDLALWKCFIGCWERHPQIKTTWFVGRRRWDRTEPDSYSLDLALSSEGSVESKELWQRGRIADPVWLKLQRIGSSGRVLGLIGFVN